ncbi:ribosome small subunit-dependent GTPase A [Alginatibacterium sediminis]|uniref:Small ribosomal subunit biogenesis GTPase RsgA n=1 Tax=Alginatibacterium sediminis TaxID=2164068 RepID=A0A420E9B6_9ALTE|nr:ribosome small subunit-dependent GTPase A [Alginatibacterium sediminis]RKF15682.1 ribosome small subunit-dependent GTPase A [Alginatibacterium sediminis]
MQQNLTLAQLGWRSFFQQQLLLEEYEDSQMLRVFQQFRNELEVQGENGSQRLPMRPELSEVTVGDWLLCTSQGDFVRSFERFSLFARKAPGSQVAQQLIAANIDTVFIVVSLNNDFNLSRIERYLSLANQAQVQAVIVLSKADLCDETDHLIHQVQELDPLLNIVAVNALQASSAAQLLPWCKQGQTIAFLGSSGAGKSTLVNALLGSQDQLTGSIREDDSKGRHTTTGRSIHPMPSGALLMDTPGMRELQLADVQDGIEETFSEINALASSCRFADCQHESEPGCAVVKALEQGEISERRLQNYHKLLREQAFNSATLAEKRSKDKAFGKHIKSVQKTAKRIKKTGQ